MPDLSNTNVAWITAGATLVSSLLTGGIIFFIENYKRNKSFKQNQRGVVALLSSDVLITTGGLELLCPSLIERLEYKNERIPIETFRQINMYLDNANNQAISSIIYNYNYLPSTLQFFFVEYYRQMLSLNRLCNHMELHEGSLNLRNYLPRTINLVSHFLSIGSKVLAEIARYEGNYRDAILYDKAAERYLTSADKAKEKIEEIDAMRQGDG